MFTIRKTRNGLRVVWNDGGREAFVRLVAPTSPDVAELVLDLMAEGQTRADDLTGRLRAVVPKSVMRAMRKLRTPEDEAAYLAERDRRRKVKAKAGLAAALEAKSRRAAERDKQIGEQRRRGEHRVSRIAAAVGASRNTVSKKLRSEAQPDARTTPPRSAPRVHKALATLRTGTDFSPDEIAAMERAYSKKRK